jgi:hypothetical protein
MFNYLWLDAAGMYDIGSVTAKSHRRSSSDTLACNSVAFGTKSRLSLAFVFENYSVDT